MNRTRALTLTAAAFLLLGFLRFALGEDILERVRRLRDQTHYNLASQLLEDHVKHGTPLSRELRWLQAELETDPERFDRMAASLTSGGSVSDSLNQVISLARAREYFARGRYLSAAEFLEALPPEASRRLPEIALFSGMAEAAAGNARKAKERLLLVEARSPSYPMAQVLLADLGLRSGDVKGALRYAEAALATGDRDVAPQALYARAVALSQSGDGQRAAETRSEILRRYPRTAEASWVREEGVKAARDSSTTQESKVSEVEAPVRRSSFALQMGAFHDRSLALKLALTLESQVDELRIERSVESSPPWYRVIVGRFATRSAAESVQDKLKSQGWQAVILPPGQS